jgi:hypothetical protein
MVEFAKRCDCGAVTLTIDGRDISMPYKQFKSEYPGTKLEPDKYSSCNYCVNHWGTDICECGSGKKVGKCKCGSKKSSVNNGKLPWKF